MNDMLFYPRERLLVLREELSLSHRRQLKDLEMLYKRNLYDNRDWYMHSCEDASQEWEQKDAELAEALGETINAKKT